MIVRTRFAPSPTGYLHIGGVRTALFCYLYAKRHGGQFVLRIEDTDRQRSTAEAVDVIVEGMAWLGLTPDEGPFFQTQRFDRYTAVLEQLIAMGRAYRCYCTREELDARRDEQLKRKEKPRYDGRCRERGAPRPGVEPVVRFLNPDSGEVVVDDLVRGRVVYNNEELDDLIIARSDGTPTYNFTVVVDDIDMAISHVVRGDDHLNNTPRQINIMRALDWTPPAYAHVPMILGPDGARLSKRHGAVSVLHYRDEGYLPDALLNYLVRLGWSHGDQEIFSRAEMTELFDIADVNKSASTFNAEKLLWLNQQTIKDAPAPFLASALASQLTRLGIENRGVDLELVVEALRERAKTLAEMAESSRLFLEDFDDYEPKAVRKHFKDDARVRLAAVRDALAGLPAWRRESIDDLVTAMAAQFDVKMGLVAQPIRVAVAGCGVSPPIGATLMALGRERTLERIGRALDYLDQKATSH